MASEEFAATRSPKSKSQTEQIQLEKLLVGKQLKNWTVDDVIIWLKLTNEGVFSKYAELFETQQIDGRALMTLDEEKAATDLLGTQHQINSFVQSIKTLKRRNGRKMSAAHRRRQSRRSLASLNNLNLDALELPDSATPSTPSGVSSESTTTTTTSLMSSRSKTPTPVRTRPSLRSGAHSVFMLSSSPSSGPINERTQTTTQRQQSLKHQRTMTPTLTMSRTKSISRSKSMSRRNKRTRHHASQTVSSSLNLSQLHIAPPSASNSINTGMVSSAQTLPEMMNTPSGHAIDTPLGYGGGDNTPSSVMRGRQRTLSDEDHSSYIADPSDKKALWKLYRTKEMYSAILCKRGKIHTAFKKRWFVLCAREFKAHHSHHKLAAGQSLNGYGVGGAAQPPNKATTTTTKKNGLHLRNCHSMSLPNNMMPEVSMDSSRDRSIEYDAKYDSPGTLNLKSAHSMHALHDFPATTPTAKSTKIKLQRIKSGKEVNAPPSYRAPSLSLAGMTHGVSFDAADRATKQQHSAYLFYFNERPIKKSDNPNGYISLNHVQCVLGLLNDREEDESKQRDENNSTVIKYKKKKGKQSEYYEIVLKTNDREWIFGALDSKSYLDW
eukprot:CAMPEP_0202727558 /NCGR_PEP_ID=MMETSP1385-20130828/185183_1 /ASSEMBLY_ACC=CAM_ASM_000861 /TAXON_ID=933848 /ORGANISM="Elphidium margaritaceum" /LENGTH=606 /DNA_ID=CAMNT_0049393801 /DNA_START=32 /DNA_END=1849 /DNA_ORIENTATION=+